MKHIVNWQTAIQLGIKHSRPEVFTKPSQTVPGMTLSLEQLLARYVRGENVTSFQPVYQGDDTDLPDLTGMTEMDKLDLARQIKSDLDLYRAKTVPLPEPKPKPEPAPTPDAPEPQSTK